MDDNRKGVSFLGLINIVLICATLLVVFDMCYYVSHPLCGNENVFEYVIEFVPGKSDIPLSSCEFLKEFRGVDVDLVVE